jgi:Xaa-Pro aminopeptidase
MVFADYDNDLDVLTNPGYVTIYVGATTLGTTTNLSTGVTVNNASNYGAAASTTIITADEDADKTMRPGHIIHAQDDAVLGTIASVTSNLITLTAANVGALTDDDELYIVNPIKFNFGFTTY